MWLRFTLRRMILPLPVILNRFFAPRCVFIFGMVSVSVSCRGGGTAPVVLWVLGLGSGLGRWGRGCRRLGRGGGCGSGFRLDRFGVDHVGVDHVGVDRLGGD